MSRTPTEVAAAAATRFRTLREQATARLARRTADLEALRANNAREAKEMMARAKDRTRSEPESAPITAWPDTAEPARYQFDDQNDPDADVTPPTAPQPQRTDDDAPEDDMSQEDTWLR